MVIRGKFLVVALLVLAMAALTPAFGAEQEKLGDANWTGPLETSNPNVIPKNHLYIETYFVGEQDNGFYNNSSKKIGANNLAAGGTGYSTDYQSATLFAYGITNKFNLQFIPVFDGAQGGTALRNSSGTVLNPSSNGMEVDNLTVRTPYQLHSYKKGNWAPSFTISPGFIAPTGAGDTNTWTPWVGAWVQRPFWMPGGRILRVRANQDFYFPLAKTVNDEGFCGTGIASCKSNQGTYYKTFVGMEYSLTKHWVPAWDFYWKYGNGNKTNALGTGSLIGCSTGFNTAGNDCNGFNRLAVDPALEYNFTGNVGIIFGVEMTVAGKNVGSYIAPQIALQIFK
jgi:hypothetical protein